MPEKANNTGHVSNTMPDAVVPDYYYPVGSQIVSCGSVVDLPPPHHSQPKIHVFFQGFSDQQNFCEWHTEKQSLNYFTDCICLSANCFTQEIV